MRRVMCLTLCGALLCAGVSVAESPIDDDLYGRAADTAVARLLEEGKATTGETLRSQLDRRNARLVLPSPASKPLTPSDVYSRRRDSVVVVTAIHKARDGGGWHSSRAGGFAVSKGGCVATNYHVVSDNLTEAMGVTCFDGRTYPVLEIVAADKAADVAILKTAATSLQPIPLRPGAPTGAPVVCISHPDGRYYTLTTGIISRRYKRPGGQWMSITADYAKGSSGGPILDDSGNAVGMVAATDGIYYNVQSGQPANLQMVVKTCVPAEAVKAAAGTGK